MLITSPEHAGWALAASLALSVATLALTIWVADPIKNLELVDVGYFVITAMIYFLAAPTFANEMSRWIAGASALGVLLYAVGTLAVGRPFTMQYASMYMPAGGLRSADFIRTNRIMTAMWAVVFGIDFGCLIISKSILARPNDLLFAWFIPIGALIIGFIVNARMTRALASRHDQLVAPPTDLR